MIRVSFAKSAFTRFGVLFCYLALPTVANAEELKVLSAAALRPAVTALVAQFENSSGHKVTINYGTVGALTDRLQKGEAADVAIVSGPQIDGLQKKGRIVIGSRVDLARGGIGMFVRKGAVKPDTSPRS